MTKEVKDAVIKELETILIVLQPKTYSHWVVEKRIKELKQE